MDAILVNRTGIPNSKILKIMRFVRPRGTRIPKITLRAVKTHCFYGRYLHFGKTIYASVGLSKDNYPILIKRDSSGIRRGYLSDFWLYTPEESLVYVLAHELRHSFQDQYPDAPRLGQKFTKRHFSERDADTYALWKLNNWRKKKRKIKSIGAK